MRNLKSDIVSPTTVTSEEEILFFCENAGEVNNSPRHIRIVGAGEVVTFNKPIPGIPLCGRDLAFTYDLFKTTRKDILNAVVRDYYYNPKAETTVRVCEACSSRALAL